MQWKKSFLVFIKDYPNVISPINILKYKNNLLENKINKLEDNNNNLINKLAKMEKEINELKLVLAIAP